MSDVERLEKIKEFLRYRRGEFPDNARWLVSTVKEQQKEIESWKELHGSLSKRATYLNKENARLREALRDIKDIMSHHSPVHNIAKSALEGK